VVTSLWNIVTKIMNSNTTADRSINKNNNTSSHESTSIETEGSGGHVVDSVDVDNNTPPADDHIDHQDSDNDDEGEDDDDDDEDEKGHTFRKRRLSLTNVSRLDQDDSTAKEVVVVVGVVAKTRTNQIGGGSATNALQQGQESQDNENHDDDEEEEEEDEKAHSFRKRRLSLTQNRLDAARTADNDVVGEPSIATKGGGENGNVTISNLGNGNGSNMNKRRRKNSDASVSTFDSYGTTNVHATHPNPPKYLKSKTLHAAELLSLPPPSPSSHLSSVLPKLYQQAAPPQNLPNPDDEDGENTNAWLLDGNPNDNTNNNDRNHTNHNNSSPVTKWKKRHTRRANDQERNLPFPLDVVGTFSCHGVEPIYDSDYQLDDEDDDDSDNDEDDDDVGGVKPWGVGTKTGGKHVDKPTMAAKINQDRGGVACPYGNSAHTAIFAVYDGTSTLVWCSCYDGL
jgi:hypothetical protein